MGDGDVEEGDDGHGQEAHKYIGPEPTPGISDGGAYDVRGFSR